MNDIYKPPQSNLEKPDTSKPKKSIISFLREADKSGGELIIQPILSLIMFILSIIWFFKVMAFWPFAIMDLQNPSMWQDIISLFSISTAGFFVSLLLIRKWFLVWIPNQKHEAVLRALNLAIKVFFVPFVIAVAAVIYEFS